MAIASDDPAPGRRSRGRPRAWGDTSDQNTIKSLDRAMEVLERLSEMQGSTLSDLASDLGQPAPSVYRVLYTLEARGIVDFDAAAQVWHIGAAAFRIGSRFLRRSSLVERARPVLRHLMSQTGETANLAVARQGQVLFVSQVETHATIRAFFPPGTMSPMHASGIGKALLAQLSTSEVAAIVGRHGLEKFTPQTLIGRDTLLADLEQTRARGYAIDYEEKNVGMRCIASAVFDMHDEAVAGISISGPAARIPDEAIPEYGAIVALAAKGLTQAIGGTAL